MLKSILDAVVRVPLHLPVEREFPSYEFLIAFQRDEKLPVRHVLIVPSRLALRSDSEANATTCDRRP
jgi:hypothetical protein